MPPRPSMRRRVGIPLIIEMTDPWMNLFLAGRAISFPSQLGMAARGGDPDKVKAAGPRYRRGGLLYRYIDAFPVLCIARETPWGRVDETFGEDPMLIGELGPLQVRAIKAVPRPW